MSPDDQNNYNNYDNHYNNYCKETIGYNGNNLQTNIQHPELRDQRHALPATAAPVTCVVTY
jgi:hypothetical protein